MTTHIQDTLTVSLPRMEGNKIAYSLLHNDTIVGNISQSKDGNHQVTVGISSFSGTFKSCVDWAKTNFLTGSQLLATIDSQASSEEKQMTTQAPAIEPTAIDTSEVTPLQMAACESQVPEIILDYLLNVSHNTNFTDALVSAINTYIINGGSDNNKSHDELARLAAQAKLRGIFKLTGQIKNSPELKALEDKYTPALVVSGGNERGQVLAVGTTAASVANAPKPPKGQSKGTKGTKGSKDKAPKKTKETKALPALPVITDLAALEALDRKALQSAMSITNLHKVTGVKGNGKTVDILKALAKHLLGIDDYTPTTKPTVAKGSSKGKDEVPLEIPQGLCWDEVKGMKYRQLQALCKVFRSNGLYQGNLAGKGVTSEHLLKSAAAAMRALGHDIVEVSVPAQDPDNATPTLERTGERQKLAQQATDLLALAK